MSPTDPETSKPTRRATLCDYSVGIGNARCPAEATHYRYTRTGATGLGVRKTKACEHHRYPVGQTADTESLWVVPNGE
jgi:hypothetical protein